MTLQIGGKLLLRYAAYLSPQLREYPCFWSFMLARAFGDQGSKLPNFSEVLPNPGALNKKGDNQDRHREKNSSLIRADFLAVHCLPFSILL